jgi:hypothetical protein
MYISWLHLCLGGKGSAGNDSPYLMAALVEPLLQSSHPICGILVTLCSEPNLRKAMAVWVTAQIMICISSV